MYIIDIEKEKTNISAEALFRNHIVSINHESFFETYNFDEERKEQLIDQFKREDVTIKSLYYS